jgi:hypothetical protein
MRKIASNLRYKVHTSDVTINIRPFFIMVACDALTIFLCGTKHMMRTTTKNMIPSDFALKIICNIIYCSLDFQEKYNEHAAEDN